MKWLIQPQSGVCHSIPSARSVSTFLIYGLSFLKAARLSVSDELAGKSFNYIANKFQVSTSEAQWILVGWNACRAAMLHGKAELVSNRDELKSPVVPDGWVMVPVEPTMEMLDEFDSIIDYGAEDSKDAWSRLIAAVPKQEVKNDD